MQVFKLCLKIIKKNLPQMLIYIFVFIGVSLAISAASVSENQKVASFNQEKTNIAFIAEENTPLTKGLQQELTKIANIKELPDEKESLQDALYFREVSYILRIPKGFSEGFMEGKPVQLQKTAVPDSISSAYIDLSIDKYLNTARLYVEHMEGLTVESLAESLKADLEASTTVELQTKATKPLNHTYANYFFNYSSYSLMFILIMGMSAMILVFNDPDLRRRNACSPLSASKVNVQFIYANLAYTFAAWLIMVIFCLIFNYKNIFNLNTVYFIINSLGFALCGAGISFMIGNLVRSQNAISAISNVYTLGSSFISGVMVPQELLGSSVLKIASFTPTYWFVRANDAIAALTQFDFTHVKDILSYMLIQIGFGLAFFSIALVVGKKNRFA